MQKYSSRAGALSAAWLSAFALCQWPVATADTILLLFSCNFDKIHVTFINYRIAMREYYIVYDRKEREELQESKDPFAIPEGARVGDEYVVPFEHPKKGTVEITIYLMEDEAEKMARFIKTSDAVLLTRKSRDTANKIFVNVKRYPPSAMGNVRLLRYDDVREAIAAVYRIKDSPAS